MSKAGAIHVMHIIGARPHLMKLAPIYRAMQLDTRYSQSIVHTGQHYDKALFGDILAELALPEPDFMLNIGSGGHLRQIGLVLLGLGDVLSESRPDIVFVYGDTNSTAAGAIAAAKSNIPLAHIEAGLREYNKLIPEEINKLLTDAVTDLYFCPTKKAVENLRLQGITENVHKVGDVVFDLISAEVEQMQIRQGVPEGDYYVFTCHRASNTDNTVRLESILTAIAEIDDIVVFPVHPRTRRVIEANSLSHLLAREDIIVREPLGFWETQRLIRNAKGVITDSGGLVKEAYFHRTPCVIVDDQIEWTEAVNEGWAVIAGADTESILQSVHAGGASDVHNQSLGKGDAVPQILDIVSDYLTKRSANDT